MEASLNVQFGRLTAKRKDIKTLLYLRDHLKKQAIKRISDGQSITYLFREISAINTVLNELLALRGEAGNHAAADPASDDETKRCLVEVETLSAEDVAAMLPARTDSPPGW